MTSLEFAQKSDFIPNTSRKQNNLKQEERIQNIYVTMRRDK